MRMICRVFFFAILLSGLACAQSVTPPPMLERLGYPPNARVLIIHGDDVGMAHSVDQATFEALEKGWITSASVMVPCPWFSEVAQWAKAHPQADLGLHLTLDSEWATLRWGPVSPKDRVPSLLDADGYFPQDPDQLANADATQAENELRAQIDRARQFGLQPTHFDSHMLALISTPALFRVYDGLGRQYRIPLRLSLEGEAVLPAGTSIPKDEIVLDNGVTMQPGVAKKDWLAWYENQLRALKPGVYELVVHLAYDDAEMEGATAGHPDWGAVWRQSDFDTMRSPEFRNFLHQQGFTLATWRELAQRFVAHEGH